MVVDAMQAGHLQRTGSCVTSNFTIANITQIYKPRKINDPLRHHLAFDIFFREMLFIGSLSFGAFTFASPLSSIEHIVYTMEPASSQDDGPPKNLSPLFRLPLELRYDLSEYSKKRLCWSIGLKP